MNISLSVADQLLIHSDISTVITSTQLKVEVNEDTLEAIVAWLQPYRQQDYKPAPQEVLHVYISGEEADKKGIYKISGAIGTVDRWFTHPYGEKESEEHNLLKLIKGFEEVIKEAEHFSSLFSRRLGTITLDESDYCRLIAVLDF